MDNGYEQSPGQQTRLPGPAPFGRGRGIVSSEAYRSQGAFKGPPRHPPPPFQRPGRGFYRPPPPPIQYLRGPYQNDSYRQRGYGRGSTFRTPPPPYRGPQPTYRPAPPRHYCPRLSSPRQPPPNIQPTPVYESISSGEKIPEQNFQRAQAAVTTALTTEELQLYSDLLAGSKIRMDSKRTAFVRKFEEFKKQNPDSNPYKTLLAMVTKEPSYRKSQRESFVGIVLESFGFYLELPQVRDSIGGQLNLELQKLAFDKFWFVDAIQIFILVCKIFQLSAITDALKPFIDQTLETRKDFRRGCEMIMALGTHDLYSLQKITIPLTISVSTSMLAETFLDGSRRHQEEMVLWLDSLTDKSQYALEYELKTAYPQIDDICTNRLIGPPLGKFIKKLLTKHDLDPKLASRNLMAKTIGAFKYLVREKSSGTMRKDNWRDLVYQQAKDNPQLQSLLFKYLTEGRVTDVDISEAVFWAKKFEYPNTQLPFCVAYEIQQIESRIGGVSMHDDEECWDDDIGSATSHNNVTTLSNKSSDDWDSSFDERSAPSRDYLEMDCTLDEIVFVDDKAKFLQFSEEIGQEYAIGLDCEFLSNPSISKETACLLQLASNNKTYLLDMPVLLDVLSDEDLSKFASSLFIEGAHIILGYGLNNDLQVLANTHPRFQKISERSINLLDLDMLSKLVTTGTNRLFDLPGSSHHKGLSGLAHKLLGKPLDKRDQISDWTRRPLTKEQMVYAALDAKVLVMIYDGLQSLAENVKKEDKMAKIVSDLKRNKNKPPSQKKKTYKSNFSAQGVEPEPVPQVPFEQSEPIRPEQLRLVCDSMLKGLCDRLSYVGVDATCIQPFETIEICGDVAKTENRMIITKGIKRFSFLAKYVKPGSCLALKSDIPEEQMKEVWSHFHVILGDDPTTCEECNATSFAILAAEVVLKVSVNITKASINNGLSRYDDYDDYDEFDDFGDGHESEDDIHYVPNAGSLVPTQEWYTTADNLLEVDLSSGKTRSGLELKIGSIPNSILGQKDKFFACLQCGTMAWVQT